MRGRGLNHERRHATSVNLEWLLHHCDPTYIRGNPKFKNPLQNQELASEIGCRSELVSRMIRGSQVSKNYHMGIFRYFKLNELDGCPDDILDWAPADFARRLRELGYGKFVGGEAPGDWLSGLTQGTGRFVPEEVLSLLLSRGDAYRGLGLEGDDIPEIPNATGVIGRRYGLALEIGDPQVEAVRAGKAFAVLVHRDRSTKVVSVFVSNADTLIGLLDWVFVRSATPSGSSFALLAERERGGGGTQVGYRINGTPGRRDLFVFLFAKRPTLGTGWLGRDTEPRLDKERSEALRAAVEDARETGAVTGTRFVYDAVAAETGL